MRDSSITPYWEALVRTLPLLILLSLLAGVVTYGITRRLKPQSEVHFSYLVSLRDREPVSEFRYDGYYALQATDLFAETLAGWIQTPEVLIAAHEAAGLPVTLSDARAIRKLAVAEKQAPQLVHVTIRHPDPAVAERLAQGLQAVMTENLETYHAQGIPALHFQAVATSPVTTTQAIASLVIAAATALLVFFVGINIRLFLSSLEQTAPTPDA